jgi:hypothetical protein
MPLTAIAFTAAITGAHKIFSKTQTINASGSNRIASWALFRSRKGEDSNKKTFFQGSIGNADRLNPQSLKSG